MKKKLEFKKIFITVIFINIIQVAIVIAVIAIDLMSLNTHKYNNFYIILYFMLPAVVANSIMSVRSALLVSHFNSQNEMLMKSIKEVENLNYTLRSQRHDFMNHLQVVYGLIDMEEFEEAQKYIEQTYNDIQKVGKILKTSNPAVNALLQAKFIFAEKKGITAVLNVTSSLSGIAIPSWELCKVLGNVIDNAIESLSNIQGNRLLEVSIYEQVKFFVFSVKDNGPGIPQELKDHLFEPGFTSKKNKNRGMGLSIVKRIIDEYNGYISVDSTYGNTVFTIGIPK